MYKSDTAAKRAPAHATFRALDFQLKSILPWSVRLRTRMSALLSSASSC